ncbi:MAG: HD domain-containing protein [Bacteroidota bacterium]|nr:HD domain-containing protein [Bacteroidota bacterium]
MIEETTKKRLNERYLRLIEISKPYMEKTDLRLVNKAFEIAVKHEFDKPEESKHKSIEHSIEVGIIAVEKIGLGSVSVICSLLHSVYEKGFISGDEINKKFNHNTLNILEGFVKLSGISTKKVTFQSEKFRKLYLSLVGDIRVVLIKLAHRLYDLRHLMEYSKEKQKTFVAEVKYIYIPIAHRLGLYTIKEELEELVMHHEHPAVYKEISEKLQATRTKRNVFIQDFSEPIRRELIRQGFDCEIKGRPKSLASIWNKMRKQNLPFEEVFDLFAIRIISNSKAKNEKSDCWKIYSIVTDIYEPNPKRLRDWISTPKASGYESLHTTVKGPNERWVEVQIRSKRMDEIAEKGQAAHWRYKGFGNKREVDTYINQVRDILQDPKQIDFEQVAPGIKENNDKVYVFTPNGDLRELKNGSTVLDFAYEIHTDIGDHCTGARVNGRNVPIRYVLNNGDRVEIMTSKNQSPKMDWLGYVVSSKAINKIKRAMLEEKFQGAEAGNEILRRKFRTWKFDFNEENIDKIIRHYKFKSAIDLYYSIASEKIDLPKIKQILSNGEVKKIREMVRQVPKEKPEAPKEESLIIDDRLKNVNYTLAKCCNPVWGDPVFGFVSIGKGITIHRLNCPNATELLSKYDYRVIDVNWRSSDDSAWYQTNIVVKGEDKIGIMGEIANLISKDLKVNMLALNVNTENQEFVGNIKVQVRDREHLKELLNKLNKIKGVISARRSQHDK